MRSTLTALPLLLFLLPTLSLDAEPKKPRLDRYYAEWADAIRPLMIDSEARVFEALETDEQRGTKPRSLDRRASRKQRDCCPVCEAKLRKIGKGTRYQRCCDACGAVHQKHLFCPSCSTHRVWAGRLGRWCKGCGKAVNG